ncbi:MAG: hypothetical protein ABWX67_11450 [Allosphingosinicella sp.]
MALNNFADVQNLLNDFVASAGVSPTQAPHGVFWDTDYESFMNLSIFNEYPVVDKGNAAASNIILALQGNLSGIPQMPQPDPPYNSANPSQDEVIAALSAWINAGCPNGSSEGSQGGPPTERRSDDY